MIDRKSLKIAKVVLCILCLFVFAGNGLGEVGFVDDNGNRIVVKKPFTRIISLYPAHTENLVSLGAGNQIIGVSPHETFPPSVLSKPVFSYHDDLEKFLQARPDLVLIRPMIYRGFRKLVDRLKESGIRVVSLQPTTIQGMFEYWKKLGILTGREREAREMIAHFNARLREVEAIVKKIPRPERKRVYFEAIHRRMKTFSPESMAIYVLTKAGGINVATDAIPVRHSNIAEYGKEKILSHAREIDVYLAQKGAMNRTSVDIIRHEPGFEAIRAVAEGQIYIINESIVSRPTLRLLEGIFEIGRFLYPEYFNNVTKFKRKNPITRADYSELFVNFFNLPLETPSYRTIRLEKKKKNTHWYGGFVDVDYSNFRYKYIETVVSLGIYPNIDPTRFYPSSPLSRAELAYSIDHCCSLADGRGEKIADISPGDCCYDSIRKVVRAGLMKLDQAGKFNPGGSVSGSEALEVLEKVRKLSCKGRIGK